MAVDSGAVQVVMPAMGDSVAEGTVLEWHKGVGDHVDVDETIVEISTDKVDAEGPSPVAGTITKILAGEGDTASAGGAIPEILFAEGDTVTVGRVIARRAAGTPAKVEPEPQERGANDTDSVQNAPSSMVDGASASPVARRVAASEGVDLGAVRGSARGGRITKADVLSAANGGAPATAPAPPAPGATPLRGAAAALARYMDESRSVPTETSF